jgi:hypothetical protein
LYGCEAWYLTLREEHRLRVFQNMELGKTLGLRQRKYEETGENWIIK